jgi:membrane protease YdiL (CAAX protease family)
MSKKSLIIYFVILTILCASIIVGAKALGQQGAYLAQFYMLTPALAALITRLFFYELRFSDANLRFGKISDYFKYWFFSLAIIVFSYMLFTLLGSVSWDFSGDTFLEQLSQQLSMTGQDINETLPSSFTPQTMLLIYFIGGLTIFNVLPGIITGFGEEFGHRGFMFPLLYKIKPWIAFIGGGLIWYAWHLPLALVIPQTIDYPAWQILLNMLVMAFGSIFAFTYFAYVYVQSKSIFITSIAHITMNNVAASLSYFAIVENQLLANIGLTLTMFGVVAILYYKNEMSIFQEHFRVKHQG